MRSGAATMEEKARRVTVCGVEGEGGVGQCSYGGEVASHATLTTVMEDEKDGEVEARVRQVRQKDVVTFH